MAHRRLGDGTEEQVGRLTALGIFMQEVSGFMNCLLHHYALHIYFMYFINYLHHAHLLYITIYISQVVHINKMLTKLTVYKTLFFGH